MVYDAESQDENKASEINLLFSLWWKLDGRMCFSVQQVEENITSRLLNDNYTILHVQLMWIQLWDFTSSFQL